MLIVSQGGIAQSFVQDAVLDPSTRGVTDVNHRIVAVGSSSSRSKAQEFVKAFIGEDSGARGYGSYAEVVNDPEVQIVYIASPASHHYRDALLALDAGKHVCCEVRNPTWSPAACSRHEFLLETLCVAGPLRSQIY